MILLKYFVYMQKTSAAVSRRSRRGVADLIGGRSRLGTLVKEKPSKDVNLLTGKPRLNIIPLRTSMYDNFFTNPQAKGVNLCCIKKSRLIF